MLSIVRAANRPQHEGRPNMAEATEHLEHAEHAQHAENKKIALLIAVLALFLSFSETLGKSAQTEAIDANVRSADTWAFFQAKDIRKTTLLTAADQTKLLAANLNDDAKAAIDKQIEAWRATAARYESDPKTGTGRKELGEKAEKEEARHELAMARYHHYELGSAAFQIGIVLASATVITGMTALAWLAGLLGIGGLFLTALGFYAPHVLTFL
jgi:hypothetical protein